MRSHLECIYNNKFAYLANDSYKEIYNCVKILHDKPRVDYLKCAILKYGKMNKNTVSRI